MKTILEHWGSYLERVVPPTACDHQIMETRRAFYAGAVSVVAEVLVLAAEDEESAIKILNSLMDECQAFSLRIGKDM